MPTSSSLRAFAQDPPAFLPTLPGATVVDDPRFYLVVNPTGARATVCRLRTDDVAAVFDEIRERAPDARVIWITDGGPEAALRELGCRNREAPLTSYVTAMATNTEPPRIDDIEVRHVETYEEFIVAMRVSADGWGRTAPEDPNAVWERHQQRGGLDWIAWSEGEPIAYAGAIPGPRGLFLTGGVTLPEARGRGAYRALVRARWDQAVRLGTPALVVHAEEASRRVLERIGFERVGPIVELVSGPW